MKLDIIALSEWLRNIARVRVLVIGDVMLDKYIWGDASRISPEAPVPVVKVERESYAAGGAANVALNIRALGASAYLLGRIGDDANGANLSSVIGDKGVKLTDGCVQGGLPTIVKTRVVCRRQQLCRLDVEAAPELFSITESDIRRAVDSLPGKPDAVIISDYAKGTVSASTIRFVRKLLPEGTLIAVDPKPRAGADYRGAGLMTPNRTEALQLAGMDDLPSGEFPEEEVCAKIHERFAPEKLVVTLGPGGMLLCESGKITGRIPTFAREVFDVSGAGDTVISVLTLALAAGLKLSDAVKVANTAAGVVVGKLGTATASAPSS